MTSYILRRRSRARTHRWARATAPSTHRRRRRRRSWAPSSRRVACHCPLPRVPCRSWEAVPSSIPFPPCPCFPWPAGSNPHFPSGRTTPGSWRPCCSCYSSPGGNCRLHRQVAYLPPADRTCPSSTAWRRSRWVQLSDGTAPACDRSSRCPRTVRVSSSSLINLIRG